MTRNDIISMAREAGLCNATGGIEGDSWCFYDHSEEIERFFHLAAAAGAKAEREAMLDLVDGYAKGNTDLKDAIRARSKE